MKIVFMGTPDFAVGILQKLHQSKHEIASVVTVADKPSGRGQNLTESAVKKYCSENNLPVLQPLRLKDENFIDTLKKIDADLFVVVAFRMLPEVIWRIPKKGTINLHASLLPKYRGAAPINWALLNGEKKTGVTTFFINDKIDTGDIIMQDEIFIDDQMNAGALHDALMKMGATTTMKTVDSIEAQDFQLIKQKDTETILPTAPKIFKKDCEIDWNSDCTTIHNFIRGLSPYPAAWCTLYNRKKDSSSSFKLLDSVPLFEQFENISTTDEGIVFPCKKGAIRVSLLQQEGKRRMHFKEFLAGNTIEDWEIKSQY